MCHMHPDCCLVVHHSLEQPALYNMCVLCVFPRSELVEKNAMLRTKVMREKEEQRERRKYNYTLLRIRLPDGCLLQGKSFFFLVFRTKPNKSVESPDVNVN